MLQPEPRASSASALARSFSFPRPESAGPILVPSRRSSRALPTPRDRFHCFVQVATSLLSLDILTPMRPDRDRALRNLYVLNLPLDATTDHFEALFSRYGRVEHAVILATLDHLARRRGFILMSSPDEARAAIENLNGHSWHRYRIEVSFAIVQRSGTPFPHEAQDAVEPPRRPKPPQQVSSGYPA